MNQVLAEVAQCLKLNKMTQNNNFILFMSMMNIINIDILLEIWYIMNDNLVLPFRKRTNRSFILDRMVHIDNGPRGLP